MYTQHVPGSMDYLMDLVDGPPHGPGPNYQVEIAPVNLKIYRRSGYEKHRLINVFIAYILEGSSHNSGLLWDRPAINGTTTNLF